MWKLSLMVLLNTALPTGSMAQSAVPNSNGALSAKTLRTKFDARMNTTTELMQDLSNRLDVITNFRRNVTRCYARGKIYQPGDSRADGRGCTGVRLHHINKTHHMNKRPGCPADKTYRIPNDVYEKMQTGVFYFDFERAGNPSFRIRKGKSNYKRIRRKVDDGGWFCSDDHCVIRFNYNGKRTLRVRCHGDGTKYCNHNRVRYLRYEGSQIRIGQ
jgi:hypothetical protein